MSGVEKMGALEKQLVWGLFPELEEDFSAKVRALRAQSKLAPIAVLVPTHLLRVHLKRALASHANIHFLTLHDLAKRLAGTSLGLAGRKEPPRFALELLLAATLEETAGRLRYFKPVALKEGFHGALLKTFRDLADACIEPEDFEKALKRLKTKERSRFFIGKLEEILGIWKNVEEKRRKLSFARDVDLLQEAAREATRSPWIERLSAFLVYGFYDLTAAQKNLLGVCIERAPSAVFFPYSDNRGFRYAAPLLQWFRDLGFQPVKASPSAMPRPAVLSRLAEDLFRPVEPEASGRPAPEPDALEIVSAPGEAREAKEVVREVLYGSAGRGTAGILLRFQDATVSLVQEALAAAGVEGFIQHGLPLSRTQEGKSLLLLAGLIGSPFLRSDVMDFILIARLKPVDWAGEGREPLPVAEWNSFSMKAGIVDGKQEWESRLEILERKLAGEKKRGVRCGEDGEEIEDGDAKALDRKLASIRCMRTFVAKLFSGLEKAAGKRRWSDMASSLSALFQELTGPGEAASALLSALESLSELDILGRETNPEMFRRFLAESLEQAGASRGAFQRNEPAVLDIMESRGVPFDLVILPGMVEKRFPQPVRQDPILLDAEREKLNDVLKGLGLPGELPLKKRRKEEEELLFLLAAGAARKRLVLTFPRIDVLKARPLLPSFFLIRTLEAATGKPFDYVSFEQHLRSGAHGRYVSMSVFDAALRQRAVDPIEHDLASLAAAEKSGKPRAILYLRTVSTFFARALRAESARWAEDDFTEFDGLIRDPKLLDAVGKRFNLSKMAIAATQLETYAKCPFEFYMKYLLAIEPIEEPERAAALSPLDRGSLIHSILWKFFTEMEKSKAIPLRVEARSRLLEIAEESFRKFEGEGVTGYPLMWRIAKEEIREDLQTTFDRELKQEAEDGFLPRYFEVRFGMRTKGPEESYISTEKPVRIPVNDKINIHLRGKIDRIDLGPQEKLLRVVDYKTGKNSQKVKHDSFHGGQALQLPLYLLAAEKLLRGIQGEKAEYDFLTRKGDWEKVTFSRGALTVKSDELKQILVTIVEGIAAGRFYATGENDSCRWCSYRYACKRGAHLDFKWEAESESTRAFKEMGEI
jgi:RecB family exonuclease